MRSHDFNKRDLLRYAGASGVALFASARLPGQEQRIFGIEVPRAITDLIPRKELNFVRLAESVVALEREADRKGLPQSPLAIGKGQSLADAAESLYRFAMPRLVALIDRSENIDPAFADTAGEMLSELHQTQHELPELFRLQTGSAAAPQMEDIRFLVQPEPPGEIIFKPGLPPEMQQPAPPAPEGPGSAANTDENIVLSRSKDFASLKGEYARMFNSIRLRPQFAESADWHLAMMRKSRSRYDAVGEVTGVPWHFIAVIHALESSFNFRAHLHNGDFPLTARTRQVPAGRPLKWLPPSDWESSAKDALRLLGFTGERDWSLERTLYRLEAYNGLGYRGLGVPTPYLWSFSNHYDRGKYVADGRFSATARSQQCGAAVMLKLLQDAGEIRLEAST